MYKFRLFYKIYEITYILPFYDLSDRTQLGSNQAHTNYK